MQTVGLEIESKKWVNFSSWSMYDINIFKDVIQWEMNNSDT